MGWAAAAELRAERDEPARLALSIRPASIRPTARSLRNLGVRMNQPAAGGHLQSASAREDEHASGGLCPLLMAADRRFVMPLATALRSLAESNARYAPLDVTVLTHGFTHEDIRRVEASLPHGATRLRWQPVDLDTFAGLRPASYLSAMSYARLLLERFYAEPVQRVLYLDADTLVLGDLAELAWEPLNGSAIGAVTDDYLDAALAGRVPLRHDAVPRVARYFNSGVHVIDLPAWRSQRIASRALDYLAAHPGAPFADQDALNVACDGAWHLLDRRWNFQDHRTVRVDRMPPAQRPAILHFVSTEKPWIPGASTRNAALHASYRARTAFRRSFAGAVLDAFEGTARRLKRRVDAYLARTPLRRRSTG